MKIWTITKRTESSATVMTPMRCLDFVLEDQDGGRVLCHVMKHHGDHEWESGTTFDAPSIFPRFLALDACIREFMQVYE